MVEGVVLVCLRFSTENIPCDGYYLYCTSHANHWKTYTILLIFTPNVKSVFLPTIETTGMYWIFGLTAVTGISSLPWREEHVKRCVI